MSENLFIQANCDQDTHCWPVTVGTHTTHLTRREFGGMVVQLRNLAKEILPNREIGMIDLSVKMGGTNPFTWEVSIEKATFARILEYLDILSESFAEGIRNEECPL